MRSNVTVLPCYQALCKQLESAQFQLRTKLKEDVLHASHPTFGDVVLKFALTTVKKQLLKQEAELLFANKNALFPPIYAYDSYQQIDWIAYQFKQGQTLADLAKQSNAHSAWLSSAQNSIQSLHNHGFIHADIKASNLIVKDTGDTNLIDFGATIAINKCYPSIIATSPIFSFHGGNMLPTTIATPFDDWYALAVTLCCCHAGHPFNGLTITEAVKNGVPPKTSGIPARYQMIILIAWKRAKIR